MGGRGRHRLSGLGVPPPPPTVVFMTSTSAHPFLARIERLRSLDRASFDEELRTVRPLWLRIAGASGAVITVAQDTDTLVSCGDDGMEQPPQVQD